jgi:hypothetical protein
MCDMTGFRNSQIELTIDLLKLYKKWLNFHEDFFGLGEMDEKKLPTIFCDELTKEMTRISEKMDF